jgi:hypothetical protein
MWSYQGFRPHPFLALNRADLPFDDLNPELAKLSVISAHHSIRAQKKPNFFTFP